MAFVFKPAIYKGSTLYELPRPVTRLRISDRWDFAAYKVPLRDGDRLTGHSREGVEIVLEGQVGSQAGSLKLSEQAMFTEMLMLRQTLDVSEDDDKFEFFLYHDAGTATYRKFKGCSTLAFEWDLSSPALFAYSLTLHAEDATLYTTGPGA